MNDQYAHTTRIGARIGILLAAVLSVSGIVHAQVRQGTISYERKIDVRRRIQDDQMKAMVPRFQTAAYELLFSDSQSVYKAMPKDEAPDPFDGGSGGGNHIVMHFSGPGDDGILYKNYASNLQLEETTLEDKHYVVSDALKAQPWKLSEETSTILGHSCKKATQTTPRGSKVIAWYCEDIPLPAGPEQFGGLPGVILSANVDSGTVVFTATIIQQTVDGKELKAPKNGKAITRADYQKKLDEILGPADAQGRRMIKKL